MNISQHIHVDVWTVLVLLWCALCVAGFAIDFRSIFFLLSHIYSFWATSPYSVNKHEPTALVSVLYLHVPKCLVSLGCTQFFFPALVLLNFGR